MLVTRFIFLLLSLAMMVAGSNVARSQTYPGKPIRMITSEAGGPGDFAARLIAQGLTGSLGQPVIVDNRPALLSIEITAKTKGDGYTMLQTGSTLWLLPYLRNDVPWDPIRDFSPITIVAEAPTVLVVHPSLPVNSVKDLIALAKAKPGTLNYSAGTRGSPNHLAAELFNSMAGVKITGIAYKGGAAALNALLTGEVQLNFVNATTGLAPLVTSGKVKALAVTSVKPSALFSGLPTVAASGLPGYEAILYLATFAPGQTPMTLIHRLNQEIVRVLNQPEVKEKFLNTGIEVMGSSPEQTAIEIKTDMARMGKVIRDAGIRAE